ncbi:unnamed protein product [Durusdinium trenchii]|uniref:Uncharacterized protein n=2 Tax=Durusdinium trenchii TaxID=1381693 RepID=A0ABP0PWR3_9DINO
MYDPDFDWEELDELLTTDRCRRVTCWQAHDAQVNVIRMACANDSHEVYTGCWDSALLRHWAEPGYEAPSQLKELHVGGFLNDFLEISEHWLLVAVSAGLIPTPGESLKVYDLTPTAGLQPVQRCFFHTRGCRALTSGPSLVASISKDALAIFAPEDLRGDAEICVRCLAPNPHGLQEVTSLCWGKFLYSGGTGGALKLWQLGSSSCDSVWSTTVSAGSWVRQIIDCEEYTIVCHSDGVSWVDSRAGAVVGKLECDAQANAACLVGENKLLVGLGCQLAFVDLRFCDQTKQDVVMDLNSVVASLDSGVAGPVVNLLAGLKNGMVETLDVRT